MRIKCLSPLLSGALLMLLLLTAGELMAEDTNDKDVDTDSELSSDRQSIGLQGRPKWEFGVGGGFFEGFDYPGSIDSNRRQFALPFFIYRSKRFRFGGGGVSAVSIEEPRWKLDWSVAASLNSSNQENSVREGMEDLDFLLELGPQIIWRAIDRVGAGGEEYRVDWSTKFRGVVSTDFGSVQGRGFVFETSVAGRIRNIAGFERVALLGGVSARLGSEGLNDYFYEVPDEFVTPNRPAFDARAGLIDIRTTIGLAFNLPKRVRVFIAASTGFYEESANRTSPLHQALRTTSAALGIVWTIKQSQQRVGILDTQ